MVNESNCKIVLSALLRHLRGQAAHADDTYITDRIIEYCPGIVLAVKTVKYSQKRT